MTAKDFGSFVAWVALVLGVLCLGLLGLVGAIALGVAGGNGEGAGMAMLIVALWGGILGVASLLAGALGRYLLGRSSRRCSFAMVVGAVACVGAVLMGVPLY